MPPALMAALRRFTHTLREFTVGQRTLAIIGLAVLAVGGIGLTAWLSQPSYSPLFTSLSPADAGSITTLLHTDGVPYQLADGGNTILVPEQDVDSERLKAASAGLPSLSNDGYGLLNNLGVTASAFQQTTTYQRALQGELANTIEAMNGVQTASVKLAIPDQTVFTSQQAPTTASVFVRTQGNATLGSAQVAAITHLVAASVDNLKPSNVSVVSADGTLLSGSGATGTNDTASSSTYESRTQSSVQAMLDRVLGAGNSTVVVSADLSKDSAQRVTQTYTSPSNAPAINEQSSTTVDRGSVSSGATGVLGPDNIAVPTGTSTPGTGSYTTSTTKNNAINQTTETTTIPAGALDRQTISVAVNKSAAAGISAASIEQLVSGAAGVDTKRGDQVDVQLVPFSKAGAVQAQTAISTQSGAETQQNIVKIATTALTVLGVLLGLFLLFRFLTGASKRRAATPLDLGPLDVHPLGGLDPELDLLDYPSIAAQNAPNVALPLEALAEVPEYSRMRASIDRMSATDPQRTAEYLRSLMDDKQTA
ncbi:flagellar basal-body MS-ring/collar protein FliF [Lysinimonas soli]|uniref:Flagellar M-ring protein n=1 Tax=Lysinimonas soli TaxID=1074233 RepID=A0ABW0NQZ2_9MICO